MLVLTRKSKQKIVIGNRRKIVVTVLKVQGGMVSLGIEADSDTPIYREELLHELEEENLSAAMSQSNTDVKKIAKKIKIKSP